MTKSDLRRSYRAARKAFVAGLDAASRDQLQRQLADCVAPLLDTSAMLGSHAAVGDEIDPVWIERRAGPHAFPRVSGPVLHFHQAEWADLKPGFQGIPEPSASAPEVWPTLLLVPLVAVTLAGARLGQGRGYYDRALAGLRQRQKVTAIGLAWDCQIAPALPADPWDMPLDWVATPTRLVRCADYR
jgi:5-formyltetrahydrofolate cyclo-ligase